MPDIEDYRSAAIHRLFNMDSFSNAWSAWLPEILKLTDGFNNAYKTLKLGSSLSAVFKMTGSGDRSQGELSGGGAAWEALVCLYLNMVLSGTRAVAIKQAKYMVPQPVSDALTVSYGNFQANTESDVLVLVFPEGFVFPEDTKREYHLFSERARNSIDEIGVHVIQCKTNWNDNAQIPMLWDMLYSTNGFKRKGIEIGANGLDTDSLNTFTYSFVTVPTQKKEIKAASTPVNRVTRLSGGNYWGKPSQSGVALALDEFFKRNLGPLFPSKVEDKIKQSRKSKIGWFSDDTQQKFVSNSGSLL